MKKKYIIMLAVFCSMYSQQDDNDSAVIKVALETYIDVVIPACEKDARTLDYVIDGIRENGKGIRRIIVVSDKPLTDKAEWFDEKLYPFSKADINKILSDVVLKGKKYNGERTGWIFQQFLKLYALYVVPGISDNVLVLDADTIFLRPVQFIDEQGVALYNVGEEHHKPYFVHAAKLLPKNKITKIFSNYSGICHHMLFQRHIMTDLFEEIENAHKGMPLWEAMLINVDAEALKLSCMSEYEIYFNYIFARHYPVKIRKLQWTNTKWTPYAIENARKSGLHYVSCHTWYDPKG